MKNNSTHIILVCIFFVAVFQISVQTAFTESAATYNLNMGSAKDGGRAWADFDLEDDFDLVINTDSNGYLLRNDAYPDVFGNNGNDRKIYRQDPALIEKAIGTVLVTGHTDSDGDGINNDVDLDDDNDGILDADENANCYGTGAGGSVFSEDFGTGTRTSTPYTNYIYEPDDWLNNGGSVNDGEYAILNDIQNSAAWAATAWVNNQDHTGDPNGRMGLFNSTNSALEEFYNRSNINVAPNTDQEFSFWVLNLDVSTSPNTRALPNITVYINDSSGATRLETFSTGNVAKDEEWHNYKFTFNPGSNSQINLVLINNAIGGLGNDLAIDDLEIQVLCDTDGDGVPNSLDLDSDNDGILDAEEAGHGQAHTNGVVNGAVGTDGIPDTVQMAPNGETVDYTVAESSDDTDTVPNFLDLDSDGDGIPDNVEAQTTIGYIPPNGTVDANGVDAAYAGGLDPTNTDATDNPDYLDIDSDNEGGDDISEAAITLSGNDVDNDGLDDATDASLGYQDPGGTIDDPLTATIILPDMDNDALTGGDIDFRDPTDDNIDLDSDNDGIVDSFEDLNLDNDNDPSTNITDSDNDGIADYLDIDSDNDGIPDNVEAQTTLGYVPPSGQDTNANGLDDAYENNGTLGLFPIDTDEDLLPDYLDGDSDNDGIPDNIEAHDINRNGIPDVTLTGSDSDNDGLDDGYEGTTSIDLDVNNEIDDPINDLPNTDGDDESDYRDTDDDNDGIESKDEDINGDGDYANDDSDGNGIPDYLDPSGTEEEIEVFNVITPNGDGVHDVLTITGLENYPNNTIRIYNRWGVLVFSTSAYNTQGNVFDGTSNGRVTVDVDNKLPVGTYFYILDYENTTGNMISLSGYLYLNR